MVWRCRLCNQQLGKRVEGRVICVHKGRMFVATKGGHMETICPNCGTVNDLESGDIDSFARTD